MLLVVTKFSSFDFQVFNCPIRADSAAILSELKGSSHDLVCGHALLSDSPD